MCVKFTRCQEGLKKTQPGLGAPENPKKSAPIEHVCVYPAKSKATVSPNTVKPAAAASKPKPESTFEQRVADEVARRLNDRAGNFALGFLLGELFGSFWEKHHRD
jgi:hypothetical protein